MLCMCEKKLIEMQEKKESPFDRIRKADNRTNKTKGDNLSSSENSLAHTRWNCKYHVVFIPKYRQRIIYGKLREDIGRILRRLCEMKDVEIFDANV